MHGIRHLQKSWAAAASLGHILRCSASKASFHTQTTGVMLEGAVFTTRGGSMIPQTQTKRDGETRSQNLLYKGKHYGITGLANTRWMSSTPRFSGDHHNIKADGDLEAEKTLNKGVRGDNQGSDPLAFFENTKVAGTKDQQYALDVAYLEQIRAAELASRNKPEDAALVTKYFELLSDRFPHTLVVAYENWPVAPPSSAEPLYQKAKAVIDASAETFISAVEHEGKPVAAIDDLHPSFTDVYGIPIPKELIPDSPTIEALKSQKPALVLPDGTAYYVFHPTPIQASATSKESTSSAEDVESKDGSAPIYENSENRLSQSKPDTNAASPLVMFVVQPGSKAKGVTSVTSNASDNAYSEGEKEQSSSSDTDFRAQGNAKEPLKVTVVTSTGERIGRLLANIIFFGAAVGIIIWFSEKRGAGGIINSEGHSEFNAETITEKLNDVKGCDEAKTEAQELVDYLMDPEKYRRLGGEAPKGILMSGPPGTGKTLLARAIAGEANVPFYYATGSSFEEVFVGVGSRRIRNLFQQARATAPCIIFIDEIDALGRERRNSLTETSRATLNALLAEMDGFEKSTGIVVIAATNLPDSLDAALRRPGRFDRNVHVDLPDLKGRKDILDLYVSKITAAADIDTKRLAKATSGASGAMLKSIVNTAALRAAQMNKEKVTMDDMEFAQDKIIMGAARTSAVIAEKTKRLTAYHEGGHALLALKTKGAIPIYKATILPRGSALGYVSQVPDEDMHSQTLTELLARMDVAMGGRAAEEFISGPENVTTGASSDFNQATRIARKFVAEFGMSDAIGKMYVDRPDNVSEELQKKIDLEVKRVIDDSYSRALNCLKTHEEDLHTIAQGLLKYETLSLDEIQKILKGETLDREGVN